MSWQYARKLMRRGKRMLTFEVALREDGVLREVVQVTVAASLGVDGIKAEVRRVALQHVQAIRSGRAVVSP